MDIHQKLHVYLHKEGSNVQVPASLHDEKEVQQSLSKLVFLNTGAVTIQVVSSRVGTRSVLVIALCIH